MKSKFKTYFLALLFENFLFVVMFFLLIGVLFFIVPSYFKEYHEYSNSSLELVRQVSDLEKRQTVIYSFSKDEIERLADTLNKLVPSSEDFFSIFTTLDNLSASTGFIITSYELAVQEGVSGKISLEIGGQGSPETFLNFLQNYKYGGGRLITMDSLDFSPSTSDTSLIVNFYSKDINKSDSLSIPKIDTAVIEKIKKIDKEARARPGFAAKDEKIPDYIPKENPFSL